MPEPDKSPMERLLAQNVEFAETDAKDRVPALPVLPNRMVFILTCLDPRVDPANVFGLSLGDAIVLRNAGGRLTDAALEDVAWITFLHAAVAADKELFELVIIHHTDCGARFFADENMRHQFAGLGFDEAALAGRAVVHPAGTVRTDVARALGAPQFPARLRVSGYTYDVFTGLVTPEVAAKSRGSD